MTKPYLRFPAVFYENLRLFAKTCGFLWFPAPSRCFNFQRRGEPAKICGFLRKSAFWAFPVTCPPKRALKIPSVPDWGERFQTQSAEYNLALKEQLNIVQLMAYAGVFPVTVQWTRSTSLWTSLGKKAVFEELHETNAMLYNFVDILFETFLRK